MRDVTAGISLFKACFMFYYYYCRRLCRLSCVRPKSGQSRRLALGPQPALDKQFAAAAVAPGASKDPEKVQGYKHGLEATS